MKMNFLLMKDMMVRSKLNVAFKIEVKIAIKWKHPILQNDEEGLEVEGTILKLSIWGKIFGVWKSSINLRLLH